MVKKVKLTPGKDKTTSSEVMDPPDQYIPDVPVDRAEAVAVQVEKMKEATPEPTKSVKKELTVLLDDTQLLADFACAALTGLVSAYTKASNAERIASDAFDFAKAMLAEHKLVR